MGVDCTKDQTTSLEGRQSRSPAREEEAEEEADTPLQSQSMTVPSSFFATANGKMPGDPPPHHQGGGSERGASATKRRLNPLTTPSGSPRLRRRKNSQLQRQAAAGTLQRDGSVTSLSTADGSGSSRRTASGSSRGATTVRARKVRVAAAAPPPEPQQTPQQAEPELPMLHSFNNEETEPQQEATVPKKLLQQEQISDPFKRTNSPLPGPATTSNGRGSPGLATAAPPKGKKHTTTTAAAGVVAPGAPLLTAFTSNPNDFKSVLPSPHKNTHRLPSHNSSSRRGSDFQPFRTEEWNLMSDAMLQKPNLHPTLSWSFASREPAEHSHARHSRTDISTFDESTPRKMGSSGNRRSMKFSNGSSDAEAISPSLSLPRQSSGVRPNAGMYNPVQASSSSSSASVVLSSHPHTVMVPATSMGSDGLPSPVPSPASSTRQHGAATATNPCGGGVDPVEAPSSSTNYHHVLLGPQLSTSPPSPPPVASVAPLPKQMLSSAEEGDRGEAGEEEEEGATAFAALSPVDKSELLLDEMQVPSIITNDASHRSHAHFQEMSPQPSITSPGEASRLRMLASTSRTLGPGSVVPPPNLSSTMAPERSQHVSALPKALQVQMRKNAPPMDFAAYELMMIEQQDECDM